MTVLPSSTTKQGSITFTRVEEQSDIPQEILNQLKLITLHLSRITGEELTIDELEDNGD